MLLVGAFMLDREDQYDEWPHYVMNIASRRCFPRLSFMRLGAPGSLNVEFYFGDGSTFAIAREKMSTPCSMPSPI